MTDSYNIIFGSRNANALNITNLSAVQYTVNWNNILRNKYKKYKCSFTFRSETTASTLSTMGLVNLSFGCQVNTYDGISQSNNLGIVYPNNTPTAFYYTSTQNDNFDFTIGYPNNNLITLNFTTYAGVLLSSMPAYVFILNMTGIPDDE